MEKSKLYDLLDIGILRKWRDRIEKAESETWLFTSEQDTFQELITALDENGKELLTSYLLAIENRMDEIHYNLKIKILNLGIKIGMELERSFAEYEE